METIGQRIKRLRLKIGLSVQDIAKRIGVSHVSVNKWESGQTSNIKLDNLLKLSSILNVTIEYIINGGQRSTRRYIKNDPCIVELLTRKEFLIQEIANDLQEVEEADVLLTKSVVNRFKTKKERQTENSEW